MEEKSRRRSFESADMTVIKYSYAVEASHNSCNNKLNHVDQCETQVDSKVSTVGALARNNFCHIDDHESSHHSQVERVCLLDTIGITARNVAVVQSCNALEDKENINSTEESRTGQRDDVSDPGCQQTCTLSSQDDRESKAVPAHNIDDEEIFRRAKEEGRVTVVYPGRLTQDGCCRFVCELLKCVLFQRQQLPMTYDQMVFLQKQQHNATQTEGLVNHRPVKTSGGLDWRRCQRTLQEVDEVLAHLEALFSLSQVPRVLFMLGGSTILPTELYEVNMEAVATGAGENSLRTSACLRQLFRTLFVADLLSDTRSVRIMTTTIMALGHRDCGVTGFKPKVDFKVPTKVKQHVISIASDLSLVGELQKCNREDLEDYIWFQVPITVKGFCK
ncbi:MAD2L1-binding protein [Triplophysa tibetana]|uniref:MAD2L1-binding protein n=1 Tax=Triplophysa tibetana TaxID=1572043 RepID=A0A5A9P6N8_9TELE|nr:MAD2L1-binding protein [Triplophysa tibetana]